MKADCFRHGEYEVNFATKRTCPECQREADKRREREDDSHLHAADAEKKRGA